MLGSPSIGGASVHGGALYPDGAFFYVANYNSSVGVYAVGGTGALNAVVGSPVAFPASDLTMTPDGAFLVASNNLGNKLGVFAVNPLTGMPTAVAGSPFTPDAAAPGGMVSAGGYVFVANGFFNTAASTVSVYAINGVSGALAHVAGSPFPRGVASAAAGIAFHVPAVCGNGVVEASEDCDDSNTASGDCCSSTCQFEPSGSPCPDATVCNGAETCDGAGSCQPGAVPNCDDGNACTVDGCDDVGGCLNDDAPRSGCLGAQKSLLLLKKAGGAKDKLLWRWLNGAALGPMQIGNPMTSASYALCVYAGGALIAGADIPAGSKWAPSASTGYLYSDATGAPDGILKALVKGGSAGKSKLLLKAKGANLDLSALPLGLTSEPLVTQLIRNDDPACWEATFATLKTDDGTQLKASTP
ncbi:MAG: beta-propeller fold lactonase family protein [Candidatus Binatia bacterium]